MPPEGVSMTQQMPADVAVMPPGVGGAGKIRVTLKLYASLTPYLPEAFRKGHAMPMVVDAEATIASIVAPLGMPAALVKLVVLNGVFVPPSERAVRKFADGDVLAIWPPVAGG
jgi:sulfur carrier protein ThiS